MEERHSTPCTHHWMLSEPDMGSVEGVCRRCGAQRTYPSSIEFSDTVPHDGEPEPGLAASAVQASPIQHALA